jgi:trehalose 6-phosphate synthase/phosphatase
MKLIIVSNRLPVSLRRGQGNWEFDESPGGLASGLRAYLRSPAGAPASGYVWVGWPGATVEAEMQTEVSCRCREEYCACPVFLSREETEDFYEGFCNNTLWPLFHYFPSKVSYDENGWAGYERVNRAFAEQVLEVAEPGDLVWVHDYHLLLLPALLREKVPGLRVGYFLHIPFPSYEMFRMLPDAWRTRLLRGMLGADVVGFHTHDYTQYFLKSVRRILGHEHDMGRIMLSDRQVAVDTFPMGIEFGSFETRAAGAGAARAREELLRPLGDSRIVLSIDRLDYTKGITNRLMAYDRFLDMNPDWRGKVVLLMIVVPSRTGVEDYQRMKMRTDELVGQINGRFGTLTWTPIIYQYRSLPQEQLIPLYSASDVMLVTPMRDGMNLVAKEYVASRPDDGGVLILSEMAGAASELGEATIVNPNDVPAMARAIKAALEMPTEIRQRNMAAMRERLRRYDVVRWAGEFLEALQEDRTRLDRRLLSPTNRARLFERFRTAARRLVVCDYDGTLVPLRSSPGLARPDGALLATLDGLAHAADVVIVSGRSRADLDGWFGGLDVALVAEHGAWFRERSAGWSRPAVLADDWKAKVRDLMERYVDRLPGAFVEDKEYTVAWHFRRADPEPAAIRIRELADHLISLTETSDLKVIEGDKVIEVKPSAVSKTGCCQRFLARGHDFVLAMGDVTDEELFKSLPENVYSVRVGLSHSYARFNVAGQGQARGLLESLAALAAELAPVTSPALS